MDRDKFHFRYLPSLVVLLLLIVADLSIRVSGARRHRGDKQSQLPVFRPMPQNLTVAPGEKAILKCKVENLGTKTISWHRTDQSYPLTIGMFTFTPDSRMSVDINQRTNEVTLTIQDVKPEDEGVYQCLISSKELQHNTFDVKLNVKENPNPPQGAVLVKGTQLVDRGGRIELKCNASGRPEPPHDVDWYKEGNKIQSDDQNNIVITKKIETKAFISVLVIKRSRLTDAGDYVCRSTNRDFDTIKVHIINAAQEANVKRDTASEKFAMDGEKQEPHFDKVTGNGAQATVATERLLIVMTSLTLWALIQRMT